MNAVTLPFEEGNSLAPARSSGAVRPAPSPGSASAPTPCLEPLAGCRAVALEEALDLGAAGSPLVTVNRRLARDLAERFARRRVEAGDAWWDTPAILPLSAWLVACHDEALGSGVSTRARLPALVARRRWSGLVARRHEALLDVDSAAREAMRAWQLGHAWDCLPDADDYLSDDQFAWKRWADAYAERLDDEELVDAATLADHVAALIAGGAIGAPARLVLAGFIAPTPQQRRLVAALAGAGTEVLAVAGAEPATPRCVSWPDDRTELRAIADAVRARLEADPGATLGVVVPDLDARRAEVLRAFDRRFFPLASPEEIERVGRPYDVSLGRPLADAPPARAALLALRLAFGSLPGHGVSALLLSPYVKGAAEECRARERLERRLREWRVRSLALGTFAARLDDDSRLKGPLFRLDRRLRPFRRGRRSAISDWADRFGDALRAWGWPGDGLSSEEYQAVQALHGTLDDLQSLEDGGTVSLDEALEALHRLAAERVFQPETPDVPVRILGRLESHGLRFDALWVASLDGEHWPPAGSPSPFLPVARQRAAGMPEASPEARLALALAEFDHWRASTAELVASCARERDGKPLVPAAVLSDIVPGALDEPDPVALVRAAIPLESIDDATGPPTGGAGAVRGGARLLEDQAKCPFRAFARHRLGLRALEDADIGPDPRQRGTLLHLALEAFWRRTVSHAALVALDADALGARIDECVDEALATDEFMDEVLRRLERVRLNRLVAEWIERAERPRAPFEVVGFEQEVSLEHGGIGVTLRIDRIDRVGDRLVVIDYKTGTSDSIARWAEPRLVAPQLPLYALAEGGLAGVAFARVVAHRTGFLGVAEDGSLLPGVGLGPKGAEREWPEWRALWRGALDRVAGEVRSGGAGVSPTADACGFCELRGLCRIEPATLRGARVGGDSGEEAEASETGAPTGADAW